MKKYSYQLEYQIDTLTENRQNWFDNCPIARTLIQGALPPHTPPRPVRLSVFAAFVVKYPARPCA